jgi:hypothetical protein
MRRSIAAGLVLACLTAAGCTVGVVQPKGKVGMTSDVKIEQVTEAILAAGAEAGWTTKLVRPGLIEGSREWGNGKHSMTVEVIYDAKNYEIKYKDSKNLQYDGSSVHRQYWLRVQRWDEAIKARTWKL